MNVQVNIKKLGRVQAVSLDYLVKAYGQALADAGYPGASEIGARWAVCDTGTGKKFAELSYNGRVWGLDGKEIQL